MSGSKLAGGLWIAAGLVSALILPFVLNIAIYAVIFAVGAVVGIGLGILLLRGSSPSLVTWSSVVGVAWLVAYGWVTIDAIDQPIEEVIPAVLIAILGVAGSIVAYLRRPLTAA